MIKEDHARGGTRVLWLSVSNDLRFDAERDLADVGAADIPVFPKVLLWPHSCLCVLKGSGALTRVQVDGPVVFCLS